jgi:hypothetical protein
MSPLGILFPHRDTLVGSIGFYTKANGGCPALQGGRKVGGQEIRRVSKERLFDAGIVIQK